MSDTHPSPELQARLDQDPELHESYNTYMARKAERESRPSMERSIQKGYRWFGFAVMIALCALPLLWAIELILRR